MRTPVLALPMLLAAAGCAEGPETGAPSLVAFVPIAQGDQSGIEPAEATHFVASEPASWADLWRQHGSRQTPPPERPHVDLNRSFVVAVFAGQRPTSGHGVNVTDVRFTVEAYVIAYTSGRPGPDCPTAPTVTHPHHFVAVDRVRPGAPGVRLGDPTDVTLPCD